MFAPTINQRSRIRKKHEYIEKQRKKSEKFRLKVEKENKSIKMVSNCRSKIITISEEEASQTATLTSWEPVSDIILKLSSTSLLFSFLNVSQNFPSSGRINCINFFLFPFLIYSKSIETESKISSPLKNII